MAGVNKVTILGRLGGDPELKTTTNGQQVTQFNVATSENWTDKEGNKQERTEWHRIVVWGRLAETCAKYLAKGRQVYVEGKLQTRSWEDQNGQKRYTTEIVAGTVQFIGSANERSQESSHSAGGAASAGSMQNFGPEPSFDANEEIPF